MYFILLRLQQMLELVFTNFRNVQVVTPWVPHHAEVYPHLYFYMNELASEIIKMFVCRHLFQRLK
jgi:hypothetical protein